MEIGTNPALSSSYFDSALGFEDLAIDVERMREMAYALACSQVLDERAQNAIHAFADLCDHLHVKTKRFEERFTTLAAKYRES